MGEGGRVGLGQAEGMEPGGPGDEGVAEMSATAMYHRGLAAALLLAIGAIAPGPVVGGAKPAPDPSRVVPLEKIAPEHREGVAEVIREATFHRQGAPDTFPCHPKLYAALLNEPAITLALWQDLSESPAKLRMVKPGRYEGTDGAGTTASWEFVLRSPRLNVMMCDLEHVTPRGNGRIAGRIVLVVRSGYFRETDGEPYVQHDIEAFVKIDTRGWKALAKTVRPLIEKALEEQVQEAGWFVSLMGRLVVDYPNWASDICMKQEQVPLEARQAFRQSVLLARKPGASPGRPQMIADGMADAKTRRR